MAEESKKIELRTIGAESEFSIEFLQGMINRMIVSYHKYGPITDAYPQKVNALDSLRLRLEMYERTHNTEYLIDAANFAMVEFMLPSYEDAIFLGTDSDGSPGRVDSKGTITTSGNSDL